MREMSNAHLEYRLPAEERRQAQQSVIDMLRRRERERDCERERERDRERERERVGHKLK